MKELSSCALFGATRALGGIRDAAILQHSVAGCQWGTLSLGYAAESWGVHQASSVIYEPDITFGGMEQLNRLLTEAEKEFTAKKAFFVISGCVPNMIGDDVESVVKKHRATRPVVHVKAPGYAGNMDSGVDAAYQALLLLAENEKSKPTKPGKSINLFGLMSDDLYQHNDLCALRELLGEKVRVNCCTASCTIADIQGLAAADLNVCVGYGRSLCQELEKRYGQPWVKTAYPYGIVGVKALLLQLAEALQVDFTEELNRLEEAASLLAYRGADYLMNLYGLPVAVIADKGHLSGMVQYLQEELGMLVVLQADTADTDMTKLEDSLQGRMPALLCGSSFLQPLADKYQLPLLRMAYPVTDTVNFSDRTYCGERGAAFLLETIVNAALRQSYKRQGLYAGLQGAV